MDTVPMEARLHLEMLPQPGPETCGPTALHAVYRYYGDDIPLDRVIAEVSMLEGGGRLRPCLPAMPCDGATKPSSLRTTCSCSTRPGFCPDGETSANGLPPR